MLGRWIGYLLGVVCSFLFFCFYKEWFSWLLFIGLLWLPVFSLLLSLPAVFTTRIRIHAVPEVRAGMPARASLHVEGPFPRLPLKCILGLENTLNGERFVGKPGELIPTEHCGQMIMRCKKLWVYDYLGLWRFLKKATVQSTLLIFPRPLRDKQIPAPEQVQVRAWKPCPGGGITDNYDLRPYRPGDELHKIHWKLSAKTGTRIYREALEPVQKNMVLTLTLSGTPEQLDRKLGRLQSISTQLLHRGMPHRICCQTGTGLFEQEIKNPETQQQALSCLLSAAPAQQEALLNIRNALWQCRIGGDADEA